MNASTPIIKAQGLMVKREGRITLNVPEFTLGEGELLALLGPNGAGKSTLLLALSGLLEPQKGVTAFRGAPVYGGNFALEYRRKVGVVFQDPLLLRATVAENVATGLYLRGVDRKTARATALESLERFSIAHLAGRPARALSGGEAQRTALARAFATKPEVIFLDEPFSALDAPTRESILADLGKTLKESSTAALFVTHDRAEALYLADRIAVMRGGEIVQIGLPGEVMERPVDEFVASFMGMETLLSGVVEKREEGLLKVRVGDTLLLAVGNLPVGSETLLGIRPEYVTISRGDNETRTSACNTLHGKVVKLANLGPVARVWLNCGISLSALVTARSVAELGLSEGQTVTAAVKATAIHLVPRRQ